MKQDASSAREGRHSRSAALPYLPGLDALRALAVVAVFAYHALPGDAPGGFIGVDVFFVLSGYLITSLLIAEHRAGSISLRRFWIRRARRLLPAVALLLAGCLLVCAAVAPESLAAVRRDGLAAALYVQNWNLVAEHASYFGAIGRPPLLQHLWSLSVEEQFYLVWPLVLVVALPRVRPRTIVAATLAATAASAVAMALLYTPTADPSRVYYGTDTRGFTLLSGCVLAFVLRPGRLAVGLRRGRALDLAGGAALAALVVVAATVHDYDPDLYRGGLVAVAGLAAVAVAALAQPGRLAAAVSRAPLLWLGRRSYGIYLWHWPVIVLTRPHLDVPLAGWPLLALRAAVTVALAAASYRFVEAPIRRRGFGWIGVQLDRRPRRLRATACAAAVCVIAAVVWSALLRPAEPGLASSARATAAARATPSSKAGPAVRPRSVRGRVLAVGDSVMLAAAPALERALGHGVRVDAAVGRQPAEVVERLAAYRAAHALPRRVVVQLGDNGPVWWAELTSLRDALRDVRRVVLVTVRVERSWQDEVNRELTRFARGWEAVRVADWYGASDRAGLLWDGEHPDAAGQALYASVVRRALADT